ncbi:hypothetical protein, partial [Mesomycoplasma hyopneumoniae]|uniref:hypothetical protein n=1 Tax=Mesomycoplasma hyopneumoniae TaxID=2099 RepID=UPI00117C7327
MKEAQNGLGPTIYNSIYNNLSLTNRYIILTYNDIFLGYDTDIVTFSQYKTVPSLLKNNLHFYKSSNYSYEEDDFTYSDIDETELINPYLSYHNETTAAPEIRNDIYFNHPEYKVKAGFMNASTSEINSLFKTLFSNFIIKNISIKNIFDKYLSKWKQYIS